MKKLVIASTGKSAGKTSIIVGLGKVLNKSTGYIKPFGDRLFYRKKRLWDYDSAVVANALGLVENPEDISIGFEHSKLQYMYDENGIKEKLDDIVKHAGKGKDFLFVECGKDLSFGSSVYLDPISIAKYIDGELLIVASGNDQNIIDDVSYLKKYVDMSECKFAGVIANKVHDIEDFKTTAMPIFERLGVNILGAIPDKKELSTLSLKFLSDVLFAKVIAGENGLNNYVKNIFVGAMSANAALRSGYFKTENKLIITSGDRSDMILAAIETNAVGIVLSNNILPPANIIAQAEDKNIPMLLVGTDTYQTAKKIDDLEPLLTKDDDEKVKLIEKLVKENVSANSL